MSITHPDAVRAVLAEALADYVDTGSGTAVLRLRDEDNVTLIDFELQSTAYSSDDAGAITLLGVPVYATAAATGTIDNFQVLNRDGNLAYEGIVTGFGAGGDLEVTDITMVSGRRYALDGHTYRAAP